MTTTPTALADHFSLKVQNEVNAFIERYIPFERQERAQLDMYSAILQSQMDTTKELR